ncbi:unnamed protein product [Rhizopus stolonifer]
MVNHAQSRPTNTTIAYEERQKSFKLLKESSCFFLKTEVIPNGKKKQKTNNGIVVPLGKESILAYVKAMTDLYQSQVALRLNKNPHPRGNAIRALIDTLGRDEIKRKKEQFEDRGKHTISDGYTKGELVMVSRYFLQTNASEDLRFWISCKSDDVTRNV